MSHYVVKDGQPTGPFSEEQLRDKFVRGEFLLSDLCWREGMPTWVPLGRILGLVPDSFVLPSASPAYAGLGRRFCAFLIDLVLIVIAHGIVLGMFYKPPDLENVKTFEELMRVANSYSKETLPAQLPLFAATWLYFALMETSRHQASLGKMALGLVVTNLNGEKITFLQASIRYLVKNLLSTFLLLGFLVAAMNQRAQALHDLAAQTLVLRKR